MIRLAEAVQARTEWCQFCQLPALDPTNRVKMKWQFQRLRSGMHQRVMFDPVFADVVDTCLN